MLLSCLGLKGGSLWYIFVISIKDIKKKKPTKKNLLKFMIWCFHD